MEEHIQLDPLDHRPNNLLLLGLWLRASFIGAAFVVAGFASLIDPPQGVSFLNALTCVLAGGTVAWVAWQKMVALLDRIDEDEPAESGRDDGSKMPPSARASASS